MREIKFRYWYKSGADLYYKTFTLDKILNGEPFEELSDTPLKKHYKMLNTNDQYTGIKDTTGKEIYEGDVIEYTQHQFSTSHTYKKSKAVKWVIGY